VASTGLLRRGSKGHTVVLVCTRLLRRRLADRVDPSVREGFPGVEVASAPHVARDLVRGTGSADRQPQDIGKVWQFRALRCGVLLCRRLADNGAVGTQCLPLLEPVPAVALPSGWPSCPGHPDRRGSEFRGVFDHACAALGIAHRRTQSGHAWTHGLVERLQGTILTELWRCAFRRTYYVAIASMQRDLDQYLRFYNTLSARTRAIGSTAAPRPGSSMATA
jgi:transposase InsO family protein